MSRVLFTPSAERDLNHILDWIAEDRPLTAVKVITKIRDKCRLYATQPKIGQRRPEFPGEYRSFPVDRWVVFYRTRDDGIEVHRVLDGSQDLDSLLGS